MFAMSAWSQDIGEEEVKEKPIAKTNSEADALREKMRGIPKNGEVKTYATPEIRTYKEAEYDGHPTQLTIVTLKDIRLSEAKSDPILFRAKPENTSGSANQMVKRPHNPGPHNKNRPKMTN
ncbi:MAG: hypothetical protein RMJ89_10260 [Flammeovirgaceae bacterium]|nr:hypothetical protein [Flammeovirgaceae bacterium]